MKGKPQEIPREVVRRDRKTASICVERDGRLSVVVPESFSDEQVERLVESKRYWIHKSLAEWRGLNAARVRREYVNGEGFPYLGRSYRLRLVRGQDTPLLLKNGYFRLRADRNGNPLDDPEETFKAFYREKGRDRIPGRVRQFEARLGLNVSTVRVMELRYRWASCSKHGLNFHWKCMMAPPTVLDYIVAHELAHLIHPNHSKAFWSEVDKLLPDYRERQAWLRQHGARLSL